jgi:hypothetical protein
LEVVYAFCERARPAAVRIPFFDYDKRLFILLKNQGGGGWNNIRHEFVFPE